MIDAHAFIEAAKKCGAYSLDVEHAASSDLNNPGFELWGVSFATEGFEDGIYVTDYETYAFICRELFPLDVEAIAYNGKYDLKCLVSVKVITPAQYPKVFVDPMVGVNLLDESRPPNRLGLKRVIEDAYGHKMVEYEEASSHGRDSAEFAKYACEDAEWELKLWLRIKPRLEEQKLLALFERILMPAEKAFADVELVGIQWDFDYAKTLLHEFQRIRKEHENEVIESIGMINLNSPQQVSRRLFDELGYSTKGLQATKKGDWSVDADAMDTLAKKYPVCASIKTFRTCHKMIGTYIEPITRRAMADPNGRVHPTFWLVSKTGRTRCDKPNFQNIPAWLHKRKGFEHLNIRKAVIAKPGFKLIVADLSQIELRMIAHITQDKNFLKAYRKWTCTACGKTGSENHKLFQACPNCGEPENEDALKGEKGFWHGKDLHQQTTDNVAALKGDRQSGKMSNFAIGYYATARIMHYEYPALTIRQWQDIIDDWLDFYSGVRDWHGKCETGLSMSGRMRDVFGRLRRISKADIARSYKHALNQFINFSPQASACTLIEFSLVKLREQFIEEGVWLDEIFCSNFVHDELVFEAPEAKAEAYSKVIREVMESTVDFSVPIRADVAIVDRWGEMK